MECEDSAVDGCWGEVYGLCGGEFEGFEVEWDVFSLGWVLGMLSDIVFLGVHALGGYQVNKLGVGHDSRRRIGKVDLLDANTYR